MAAQGNQAQQNSWGARSCEADAKQFTKCLDENQGNMQICNWYLEQLVSAVMGMQKIGYETGLILLCLQKACQSAASQY